MRTKISVAIFIFVLILFLSHVNLPGFEGYLLDKGTGEPIENAYIISLTDYYPFFQRFNLGGPNSYPDSFQITKSDKNGFFKVTSYNKFSGGWVRYRRIYFVKEGYSYAKEYLQLYEKRNLLRRKFETYRPSEEVSLNSKIKIFLSNQEENDMGEPLINGYLSLLGESSYYQGHFKYDDIFEYKKLRPVFLDLLRIFRKQSPDVVKTFTQPHLVDNWNHELKWFGESMEDKSS